MKTFLAIILLVALSTLSAGAIGESGLVINGGTGTTNAQGGQNFLMVSKFGSDTTGQRNSLILHYLTIGQAKTNAQSGDTIYVLPGVYAENDLLKNGVAYQFWPGVTISNNPATTDTNGWGIFDDRAPLAGKGNYKIFGYPNIWCLSGTNTNAFAKFQGGDVNPPWNPGGGGDVEGSVYSFGSTNFMGCIVLTNGSSMTARLGNIQYGAVNQASSPFSDCAGILCFNNGPVDIEFGWFSNIFQNITVSNYSYYTAPNLYIFTTNNDPGNGPVWLLAQTQGVYWGDGVNGSTGETHIRGRFLDTCQSYGLWCNQSGQVMTNESHLYWSCDLQYGSTYLSSPVTNTSATNMVIWMDVDTDIVSGTPAAGAVGGSGPWKLYYKGDKVQNNGGAALFGISGLAWIDAQKLSVGGGGVFANIITTPGALFTTYADINVDQFQDLGGTPFGIQNQGGAEVHIRGGHMNMLDGAGILHTGSNATTYVESGFKFDGSAGTHTNDWPVVVNSNGLHLGQCTLISPPLTTNSVFSTNGATVSVDNYATANRSQSSLVTLSVTNFALGLAAYTANLQSATITNLTVSNINGSSVFTATSTNITSGSYTMRNTDTSVVMTNASVGITLTLPSSPVVGIVYCVSGFGNVNHTIQTGNATHIYTGSGGDAGTSVTLNQGTHQYQWTGSIWIRVGVNTT